MADKILTKEEVIQKFEEKKEQINQQIDEAIQEIEKQKADTIEKLKRAEEAIARMKEDAEKKTELGEDGVAPLPIENVLEENPAIKEDIASFIEEKEECSLEH